MITYYEYPSCSTCRKARAFLEANKIEFHAINITDNPPSKDELRKIIEESGKPIKKFFNSSGQLYRDQNVKDKLIDDDFESALAILSTSGMMMKRPLLVSDMAILNGFKEQEWQAALLAK